MAEFGKIEFIASESLLDAITRLENVAASLGPVAVQVISPKPGSRIVLRHPQTMSRESRSNLEEHAAKMWPECKTVVLECGMTIESVLEPST